MMEGMNQVSSQLRDSLKSNWNLCEQENRDFLGGGSPFGSLQRRNFAELKEAYFR